LVLQISSFVALGDSFTEGIGDPGADGICLRGWADRFAERLAARSPALRYANLAVRGKRLREVAADQLPRAIAMRPDLVSIFAGGNDLLSITADPDALAHEFDDAVVRLREVGCQVLAFTGFDPRAFPLLRLMRGKVAAFNMHVRGIAARRGCHLADLWSMSMLTDPRTWSEDRLHLTADGHRRVALLAAEVLGIGVDEDWREPLPARPASGGSWLSGPVSWLTARASDARWVREHAAPWLVRRLRGMSAGDGIPPKRPHLLPLLTRPAEALAEAVGITTGPPELLTGPAEVMEGAAGILAEPVSVMAGSTSVMAGSTSVMAGSTSVMTGSNEAMTEPVKVMDESTGVAAVAADSGGTVRVGTAG
jgi:lysophospholipase L1-like esterase